MEVAVLLEPPRRVRERRARDERTRTRPRRARVRAGTRRGTRARRRTGRAGRTARSPHAARCRLRPRRVSDQGVGERQAVPERPEHVRLEEVRAVGGAAHARPMRPARPGEGVAEVTRHVATDVEREGPVHPQGEAHSDERRESDLAAPNIRPISRWFRQCLAQRCHRPTAGRGQGGEGLADDLLVEHAITQVTDDELLIPGGLGARRPTCATGWHAPRRPVPTRPPSASPPRRPRISSRS